MLWLVGKGWAGSAPLFKCIAFNKSIFQSLSILTYKTDIIVPQRMANKIKSVRIGRFSINVNHYISRNHLTRIFTHVGKLNKDELQNSLK